MRVFTCTFTSHTYDIAAHTFKGKKSDHFTVNDEEKQNRENVGAFVSADTETTAVEASTIVGAGVVCLCV